MCVCPFLFCQVCKAMYEQHAASLLYVAVDTKKSGHCPGRKDDLTDSVMAATNLRVAAYGIPTLTSFNITASWYPQEDDLAVDFVMAAANLRAAAYRIPTLTWFDAKGMAGNIVHAVATTNAVISGLIALEAMKLLAQAPAACKVGIISLQYLRNTDDSKQTA